MTFAKTTTESDSIEPDLNRETGHDSWRPVDLEEIAEQGLEPIAPSVFRRRDTKALFYAGKMNVVFGAPEAGKTWVAIAAIAQLVRSASQTGSNTVVAVFIDFEDDARSFLVRLRAVGITATEASQYTRYYAADTALRRAPNDLEGLDTASLVVIDTTNSAMTLDGLDPISNRDALLFIHEVRRIRNRAPQAAILLLDHEPISTVEGRRQAIGAQSKLGAVDGAQYRAVAVEQPRPGSKGVISLHLTKDRAGGVRRIASDPDRYGIQHAADLYLTPRGSDVDTLDITVLAPQGSRDDELHAVILKAATDVWVSKNQILKLIRGQGIKRRDDRIGPAVDELARDGKLMTKPKAGYIVFSAFAEEENARGSSTQPEEPNLRSMETPCLARDSDSWEEAGREGKSPPLPSSRPIRDEEGKNVEEDSNSDDCFLFGACGGDHCRCGADVEQFTAEGLPFCDGCGPP